MLLVERESVCINCHAAGFFNALKVTQNTNAERSFSILLSLYPLLPSCFVFPSPPLFYLSLLPSHLAPFLLLRKPIRTFCSKSSDWPNMHTDPFFALFPVLIECQRSYLAIRARHEWQQGSGTLWLSIRAIKPKLNDNFTCSNPNFSER